MRLCAVTFLVFVMCLLLAAHASAQTPRVDSPGATVIVRNGQTLWSIARVHGVSVDAIVRANHLRNANAIAAGQRLIIPDRSSLRRLPSGFLWPARGSLTSRFGWRGRRHHDGVDIAAPRGSAIVAAREGRVSHSGWYYGYGRTVILDHGRGLQTIYGHASRLLVREGQMVRRGQLIARVGCTGHCTGSHLHFEVRINGRAVNPLASLPRGGPSVALQAQPVPAAAPPARSARPLPLPVRSSAAAPSGPEVVKVEHMLVSEGTMLTIRTTYDQQGRLIRREQEIITRDGCTVTHVRLRYQAVKGALVLVDEQRSTSQWCKDEETDEEE